MSFDNLSSLQLMRTSESFHEDLGLAAAESTAASRSRGGLRGSGAASGSASASGGSGSASTGDEGAASTNKPFGLGKHPRYLWSQIVLQFIDPTTYQGGLQPQACSYIDTLASIDFKIKLTEMLRAHVLLYVVRSSYCKRSTNNYLEQINLST